MALVEIDVVVQRVAPVNGAVFVVDGADVYVEKADGTAVTVWQNQAGTTAATLPLVSDNGRVNGWVEAGLLLRYRAVHPSLNTTVVWEYFVSGGTPGPAGPAGPAGPSGGATGATGPQGPAGPAGDGRTVLPLPSGNAATDTAALVDALASVPFNGTVVARTAIVSNPYQLDAQVDVPAFKNLIGQGADATVFRLTTAAARLKFLAGNGGHSRDFSVHGGTFGALANHVATVGVEIVNCNQRSFSDIDVRYTTADAWLLRGTQNSSFRNCTAYWNSGNGFSITDSAGTNLFLNCGASNWGGYGISFRQTATDPYNIGYSQPLENMFIGGVFERANLYGSNGLGVFYHSAGKDTRVENSVFAVATVAALPNAFLEKQTTFGVGTPSVNFHSLSSSLGASNTNHIQMSGGSRLRMTGFFTPVSGTNVYSIGAGDVVDEVGYVIDTQVTNYVDPGCAGFATHTALIRKRSRSPLEVFAGTSTGDTFLAYVKGESLPRTILRPGELRAGSGAAAPDTVLSRRSAAVWAVTSALKLAPIAATALTGIGGNVLFVDSADNKLKFLNSAGVVELLY